MVPSWAQICFFLRLKYKCTIFLFFFERFFNFFIQIVFLAFSISFRFGDFTAAIEYELVDSISSQIGG
jgi:hypothetical protein